MIIVGSNTKDDIVRNVDCLAGSKRIQDKILGEPKHLRNNLANIYLQESHKTALVRQEEKNYWKFQNQRF